MRLKGKSLGQAGIPVEERRHFLVYYPQRVSKKKPETSKGVCVSVRWTVGKVVDAVADLLGIPNYNNTNSLEKLRLFQHNTGLILSEQMDVPLEQLFENGTLSDGQSLVLEYSSASSVDNELYK